MDVCGVGIWEVEEMIFANVNDTSDLRMKRTHFHIFIPAAGDRRQDLAWLTSLVYFCFRGNYYRDKRSGASVLLFGGSSHTISQQFINIWLFGKLVASSYESV